MGYVDNNLLPDERVIYLGKLHWVIYIGSIISFLVFLFFSVLSSTMAEGSDEKVIFFVMALLAFLYSIPSFLSSWIKRFSTELAITTKRVIAKFGFIRRNTIDLNHSKVESFSVDQGILGRLLGYGTLTINGTGGVHTPIPGVANPLEFRKQAILAVDEQSKTD